jgi:multidrug efflux pump subunit AcrA (membrane-fusion protein)
VHKVFAVVDGKAVERVISLGDEQGERVEITKGLEAGETIAVEVAPGLGGGSPVRPRSP